MTRYYKKYLPYIIFFSTVLVGGVTLLTASQLTKTPDEGESVVPTGTEAKISDDGQETCSGDMDGHNYSLTINVNANESPKTQYIGTIGDTNDFTGGQSYTVDYEISLVSYKRDGEDVPRVECVDKDNDIFIEGKCENLSDDDFPNGSDREDFETVYNGAYIVIAENDNFCSGPDADSNQDHPYFIEHTCWDGSSWDSRREFLEIGKDPISGSMSKNWGDKQGSACGVIQHDFRWEAFKPGLGSADIDCDEDLFYASGQTGLSCADDPFEKTYCGDGEVQSPNDDGISEECDDGDPSGGGTNGVTCDLEASENGYCSYCNSNCQIENLATCDALDLDQDNVITTDDVTIVSDCSVINAPVPNTCANYNLDFNSDGVIDIADIAIVSGRVGEVCSENNNPACSLVASLASISIGNTSTISVTVKDEDNETVSSTASIVGGTDGVNGTIVPENHSDTTPYSYDATYTGISVGTDKVVFTVSDGKLTSECSIDIKVMETPNNQPFCEGLTAVPSQQKIDNAYPRSTTWSFSCSGIDDDEGDSITGYEYIIEKVSGGTVDVIQCLEENGSTPVLISGSVGATNCILGNNISTLENYKFLYENSYDAKCRVRDSNGMWSDAK